MRDFLVLRWRPIDKERETKLRAHAALAEQHGYESLLDWRGMLIMARPNGLDFSPVLLPNGRGVLFGMAFRRQAPSEGRIQSVEAQDAANWAESGGEKLIRDIWGAYAAFLVDKGRDHLHVVPSPTGAFPLFSAPISGGYAVFASAQVFADIGGALNIDAPELDAFLRYPNRFTSATGFRDVRRILPGTCLTLPREGQSTCSLWRPPHADAARVDTARNAEDLRRALEDVCGAFAKARPNILHRLSGGLDSSVVLSMLKRTASPDALVAVHDYGIGPGEGDERAYARLVARHLGVKLIENHIDPRDVDYTRMLDMPLAAAPAPTLLTWANARSSVLSAGLEDALVTSGQGGDHVFYRGRGSCGPADAWRDGSGLSGFWREAMTSARRSRVSVWSILPESVRTGPLHGAFDLPRHLAREGQAKAEARLTAREHGALPWLEGYRKRHPGAVHRALLLADAQTYFGPSQLADSFPLAPPVLFEPVIEALFRIPSYAMNADGLDRGLVRSAFANELPTEIVYRRTKGQTTRFVSAILRRNRDFLVDVLRRGRLAERGLIDGEAVVDMISASARPDATQPSALTPLICAELWLRSVERAGREAKKVDAPTTASTT
ncbi:asparagine synthase-related protein [Vitreimonas flagellata]|uniref:asparagine synthase-related protein n=1 Tax=Vitreimonas flagellata TaxID=2560861 RepID=UPI001074E0A1|nr:asparagine synthase-related protein [Vitreimonas flagellata]